jgi:hypothetical protein
VAYLSGCFSLTELLFDVLIPPSVPVLLRHARHCLCAVCASEARA